jgi:Putative DNA-binding domain
MDSALMLDLLQFGERDWLEYKSELHFALEHHDNAHGEWEKGKGVLLKDLVALANSPIPRNDRYLLRGVKDFGHERKIVGIKKRFDDAHFQDWVSKAFDPPIKMVYEELEPELGKIVGIFQITFDPKSPHIPIQNFGEELRVGQVWFRRGTQNTAAKRADLDILVRTEPIRLTRFDNTEEERILKAHYAPRTLVLPSYGTQHTKIMQGYELAYYPGTRKEIHVGQTHLAIPDSILMVKPG